VVGDEDRGDNDCRRARAVLRRAGAEVAGDIERRAGEDGLERIVEAHLEDAADAVLRRDPAGLPVRRQAPHGLDAVWPRLGRVDLALGADAPAFVEFKSGGGPDALGPCAWDLIKLSVALDEGAASCGFLVAATTSDNWDLPIRGAELFVSGEWTAEGIRSGFADRFRRWELEGYRPPPTVPAGMATRSAVETCPIRVAGTDWSLWMAEIRVTSSEPFVWESLL
jgi:hypothetical protein